MTNIYTTLQQVRLELSKSSLKKTGHNRYSGFDYFELGDFLPKATELFDKHGLCPIFRIEVEPNGIEYAYLTIVKENEQIIFKSPTAQPKPVDSKGGNPIQELGSKHTYMRRYMYLMALDIVENDGVDSTSGNDEQKKVEMIVPSDVITIKANGKIIADKLKEMNIISEQHIKGLTREQGKMLCELISERKRAEALEVMGRGKGKD